MTIRFTVQGDPVPKGRPRFRVVKPKGGEPFAQTYTPAATRNYEQAVAWQCRAAMGRQAPLAGALTVEVIAYRRVPASWSKRDTQAALAGAIYPTSRPDCDNYGKAILDGMRGVAFGDDSQIVDLVVRKRYAQRPCVTVTVEPVAPAEPQLFADEPLHVEPKRTYADVTPSSVAFDGKLAPF